MPRDRDWFEHLKDFIPILVVIGIGLLSGLKRYFQTQRNRPGGAPTPADARPRHPVREEVKKYLDAYEGRETEEKPEPRPTLPEPPPREPPKRVVSVEPEPVAPVSEPEIRWRRPVNAPAVSGPSFAPRLGVSRSGPSARARTSRVDLRRAFIWTEIVGPPLALREERSP